MHSTLVCSTAASSEKSSAPATALTKTLPNHPWGNNKSATQVAGTAYPWQAPAVWRPTGCTGTSPKPVVVCLRRESSANEFKVATADVVARTKRPAVEHLKKAESSFCVHPAASPVSTSPISVPAVSVPVVNAPAISVPVVSTPAISAPAVTTPAVSTPAVGTPVVSVSLVSTSTVSASPVNTSLVSASSVSTHLISAPSVSASSVSTCSPSQEPPKRISSDSCTISKDDRGKGVSLKPPAEVATHREANTGVLKVRILRTELPVRRVPRKCSVVKTLPLSSSATRETALPEGKPVQGSRAASESKRQNFLPSSKQSSCGAQRGTAQSWKIAESPLSDSNSRWVLTKQKRKLEHPKDPETELRRAKWSLERERGADEERAPAGLSEDLRKDREESKRSLSKGTGPEYKVGQVLAKLPGCPPPQRVGREDPSKKGSELAKRHPVTLETDRSMQVPQRRVSADNSTDDCSMPCLVPLADEKDTAEVAVKKEEPNSPEMPMLLPVVVKSEEEERPEVSEAPPVTNDTAERLEGNAVVDTIDGVDFYSFSCEDDLEEFCRDAEDTSSADEASWSRVFPNEDPSCEEAGDVDGRILLPRKTNDITKIKGWRKKNFASDGSNPAKRIGGTTELSKGVRSAFVSDSLNEFLENKSELRVMHLAKLNPNINPLPEGAGVLSLSVSASEVQSSLEDKPRTRSGGGNGRYSMRRATASYSIERGTTFSTRYGREISCQVQRGPGRPSRARDEPTDGTREAPRMAKEDTPFLAMTSRNLRQGGATSRPIPGAAKQTPAPTSTKPSDNPVPGVAWKHVPIPKPPVQTSSTEMNRVMVRDSFVTDAQEVLLKALLESTCRKDGTEPNPAEDRQLTFCCPQLDHRDACIATSALLAYETYTRKKQTAEAAKRRPELKQTPPPPPPSAAPTPPPGGVQSTTRSRRPIRLPARFQDSALLLPSGIDPWELSPPRQTAPRQRSRTESTKTTTAAAVTASQQPPSRRLPAAVPSAAMSSNPQYPSSPYSPSSSSSSSSTSSSEMPSPSQHEGDDDDDDDEDCQEVYRGTTPAEAPDNAALPRGGPKESEQDIIDDLDIETLSDYTDSTPIQLSEDEANSLDTDGRAAGNGAGETLECKASRERVRRRLMLSLFIKMQNLVYSQPVNKSSTSKFTVLPKVLILAQAVKYLNGLKALSLHLDGEKRRLRQRHSQLEAQLRVARKGGPVRLEPGPPARAVPRAVTAVVDIYSPTLKPLLNVSSEILLANQRKRQALEEPGSSSPMLKKTKLSGLANGKDSEHSEQARGSKNMGRVTVSIKKQTNATSQPSELKEKGPPALTYTFEGRSIGSLRPITASGTTTVQSNATVATAATVTAAPTTPGSPQKYTLYPARGTMLGDLSKVAAAAQHLIGPCVIKRVKLRTGQTVFVYRRPPGEGDESGDGGKPGLVLVSDSEDGIKRHFVPQATAAMQVQGRSTGQHDGTKDVKDAKSTREQQGRVEVSTQPKTHGGLSEPSAKIEPSTRHIAKDIPKPQPRAKRMASRKSVGEVARLALDMSSRARRKLDAQGDVAQRVSEPKRFVNILPCPPSRDAPPPVVPIRISVARPSVPGGMWGIARTTDVVAPTPAMATESVPKSGEQVEIKKEPEEQGETKEGVEEAKEEANGAEEDLEETSEWVSGDGEMCIVRKLPVDFEEDSGSEEDEGGEGSVTHSESGAEETKSGPSTEAS